ncbi:hypothetical protein AVEN_139186-1 [Araneus ventricosus]|uniref:Uncharacterized protein n=1 Tax=Araneus ventricosus TaxID=182803 RepID=A0A4Y2DHA7_ARAVE|nr:hypothetical protein AVEN_265494-1 [Araneus ventricosus]GBM15517.1 hypothetical protein AVEN_139186-1 [Araneus ventricosus]
MLSDGLIPLHDNTNTARTTQEMQRKFKWEFRTTLLQLRFGTHLCSRHLSGEKFSSESDVKTVVENWLNGQDVITAKPG